MTEQAIIPEMKVVLLVEDHADTRMILSMVLRQHGLAVDEAADGLEALNALLRRTPHIILTDLRMPNMDGMELARHVKASNAFRHIPIVMISATPPLDKSQFPEIIHFIQKPSPMDDIVAAVKIYA